MDEALHSHFYFTCRTLHTKWIQIHSYLTQQAWLVPSTTPQQVAMLRDTLTQTLDAIKHRFKVLELEQFHQYLASAVDMHGDESDIMIPLECARLCRSRRKFHIRYEREQAFTAAEKRKLTALRLKRKKEILSRPRKTESAFVASATLSCAVPQLPQALFQNVKIGQVDLLHPESNPKVCASAMEVFGLGKEYAALDARVQDPKLAVQTEFQQVVQRLKRLDRKKIELDRERLMWKKTTLITKLQ